MHQSLKHEECVNRDQYNQSFPDKAIIFFMTFMAGTFFMCMETECLHNEKKGHCGKVSYVFLLQVNNIVYIFYTERGNMKEQSQILGLSEFKHEILYFL